MSITFREAEDRLYAIDPGKWDLTLARLRAVCTLLGEPQDACPCIVVGGSNGKGSVVAFLTSVLSAADEPIPGADFAGGRMERDVHVEDVATPMHYDIFKRCGASTGKSPQVASASELFKSRGACPLKVGSFVKPHIFTIRERVRINGEPVSETEFARAAGEAFHVCDESGIILTFFELTFLIGALAFRNAGVDIVLYEVGIGGRYDAVNVCKPFLSVITNVGADHEKMLGRTAREQAFEKAGIIPENGIVVWAGDAVAASDDSSDAQALSDANEVITAEAAKQNAELVRVVKSFQHVRYDYSFHRQKVALLMEDLAALYGRPVMENERVFTIDQMGVYQTANLDITLYALYALKALGFNAGDHRLRTGLYTTDYRGRFEVLWKGNTRVIVDAAHNVQGLKSLYKGLMMYLGPQYNFDIERMKMPVIFSCQEGKDVRQLVSQIAPLVSSFNAVEVPVLKPMPAGEIAKAVNELGLKAGAAANVRNAVTACERSAGANRTFLVCGSIYSMGAILTELESRGYKRGCCE